MRHLLLAGLVLAALGCGKDGDPTDPGDNTDPGNLAVGTFTARIDGQQWTAVAPVAVTYVGGILALGGSSQNFTTIAFAVIASAPGTYAVGPTSPTNALMTIGSTSGTWVARSTGGSGSVTITTLTSTSAGGTFQFSMVPDGNGSNTGTKAVTNGAFNVTF
jgi:hypothetical protein